MPLKYPQWTKSSLWIGAGFTAITALSALTYAGVYLQTASSAKPVVSQPLRCVTIATDPKPPLNIRSSPIVAPDNIIAHVKNGTHLRVVDENQGWLRVNDPFEGWVYKELTVTSCTPNTQNTSTQSITKSSLKEDHGEQRFKQAIAHYHAGQLAQAIALVNSISTESAIYPKAQATVPLWQRDWHLAEKKFFTAQQALKQGQWQDVINQVSDFPDNRFWRGRLAPLVKEAIRQQNSQSHQKSQVLIQQFAANC